MTWFILFFQLIALEGSLYIYLENSVWPIAFIYIDNTLRDHQEIQQAHTPPSQGSDIAESSAIVEDLPQRADVAEPARPANHVETSSAIKPENQGKQSLVPLNQCNAKLLTWRESGFEWKNSRYVLTIIEVFELFWRLLQVLRTAEFWTTVS